MSAADDGASETIAFADDGQSPPDPQQAGGTVLDRVITQVLPRDHHRIFWGDRLLSLDKSMAFLEEPRFAAAYAAIHGKHPYDQYAAPHTIAWRLHTLVWAAQTGLKLDGDFVECGVFKGHFSWVVATVVDFARQPRTFYLYDSFDGFAAAYSSAQDFPDAPGFFDFANACYKDPAIYPEVIERFREFPNVRIIRGTVPDSFTPDATPDKIAYLHIDLNSPAANLAVLEAMFDRVVPGAAIIFDDYGWYAYRHEKIVADAFMALRGYRILELPTGQGLAVKR